MREYFQWELVYKLDKSYSIRTPGYGLAPRGVRILYESSSISPLRHHHISFVLSWLVITVFVWLNIYIAFHLRPRVGSLCTIIS